MCGREPGNRGEDFRLWLDAPLGSPRFVVLALGVVLLPVPVLVQEATPAVGIGSEQGVRGLDEAQQGSPRKTWASRPGSP